MTPSYRSAARAQVARIKFDVDVLRYGLRADSDLFSVGVELALIRFAAGSPRTLRRLVLSVLAECAEAGVVTVDAVLHVADQEGRQRVLGMKPAEIERLLVRFDDRLNPAWGELDDALVSRGLLTQAEDGTWVLHPVLEQCVEGLRPAAQRGPLA